MGFRADFQKVFGTASAASCPSRLPRTPAALAVIMTQNKSLPKSDGSSFLLCEDVREEVSNKLSIIGVFQNDEIILQKGILIPSLMAVLFAHGGEGPSETRILLTDPKGQTVIESPKKTVVLEKNKVYLAAVRVLAPELIIGQYTIKFFFDDVSIQRTFEVKTS